MGQERIRPAIHIVRHHVFVHGTHPPGGARAVFSDGVDHGAFDVLEIVRVHDVCTPQLGSGPREFAEDECSAPVAVTRHVLLGDEIHTVAERGDDHDVGPGVHRDEFFAIDGPVQVMHHRPAELPELAVDVSDLPFDVVSQGAYAESRSRLGVASWTMTTFSGSSVPSTSNSRNASSRTLIPLV